MMAAVSSRKEAAADGTTEQLHGEAKAEVRTASGPESVSGVSPAFRRRLLGRGVRGGIAGLAALAARRGPGRFNVVQSFRCSRRGPDRTPSALQVTADPDLGCLKAMAGAVGFEPTDGGSKVRCLTTWRRPTCSAVRPQYMVDREPDLASGGRLLRASNP